MDECRARTDPYALLNFDKEQILVDSIDGDSKNPCWHGSGVQYKFDVSRVGALTTKKPAGMTCNTVLGRFTSVWNTSSLKLRSLV